MTKVGRFLRLQFRSTLFPIQFQSSYFNQFDILLYGITVLNGGTMDSISVNKFRDNLKSVVENVINQHEPVKVTRRSGEDFVVISAEDWEREQESLYVLQNKGLTQQISESIETHAQGKGRQATDGELNEILGL